MSAQLLICKFAVFTCVSCFFYRCLACWLAVCQDPFDSVERLVWLSRLIHSSVRSFVYLFSYFCYFLDKWNDQVSQVDAEDLIEEDLRGSVHDLARLRSLPALIASLIELGV